MTTILYKDGVIYADTQITFMDDYDNIVRHEVEDKIILRGNVVFAQSGMCEFVDEAASLRGDLFLRLFGHIILFNPLGFAHSCKNGEEAGIVMRATRNKIEVFYLNFAYFSKRFVVLKKKKAWRYNICASAAISFGSGGKTAYKYVADQGMHPEEAIRETSKTDKYTNDICTSIDLLDYFNMKRKD